MAGLVASPTPNSTLNAFRTAGGRKGDQHGLRGNFHTFPLGAGITSFPYTAATPPEDQSHESGWKVKVHLDREGRTDEGAGSRWRSGELLKGFVELKPFTEGVQPTTRVTSVIVRSFWQSKTAYLSYRVVEVAQAAPGRFAKLQPQAAKLTAVEDTKAEWHRGYCGDGGEGTEVWHGGELAEIRREVEGDFPLLEPSHGVAAEVVPDEQDETGRTTLPFAFSLPTSTRVNVSNASPQPPPNRRELQLFQRTPPPSLPGSACRHGCVEWVVEALVRFEDVATSCAASTSSEPLYALPLSAPDDLPTFHSAINSPSEQLDDFGLIASSPFLLVNRIVFPFEPQDQHAQDLYSSWRPKTTGKWAEVTAKYLGIPLEEVADERPVEGVVVPTFGRDPRDEALGGTFMGPRRAMRGKLVGMEGGRERWSSFEKRMTITGVLGGTQGWVRSEMSIRYPLIATRYSPTLPILVHLSYVVPPTSTPKSVAKLKRVLVDKAVVIICSRTTTRGGKEERPHFIIEEIRREEIKLWDEHIEATPTRSSQRGEVENGRRHLALLPGTEGHDLKLAFDLQSLGLSPSGLPLIAIRDVPLSVRTPNIEREYTLSITIHLVGNACFFALRAPLQLMAGDEDATPQFEDSLASPPLIPSALNAELPTYYSQQ